MATDRAPLHWAASEDDRTKVSELLAQKVDVDPVDDVSTSDGNTGARSDERERRPAGRHS